MEFPKFDYIVFKNGDSPFEIFLNSLSDKDSAKLTSLIGKVETYGLEVAKRMEWIKKIDDDIYELRSKVGNNIQRALYFQKINQEFMITHGFTKKTDKTPIREIIKCKNIRDKYIYENK